MDEVSIKFLGVPVPASGKKRGKQNPEQWEGGERTTQVATAIRWKTHPLLKRGRTADPHVHQQAIKKLRLESSDTERVFHS